MGHSGKLKIDFARQLRLRNHAVVLGPVHTSASSCHSCTAGDSDEKNQSGLPSEYRQAQIGRETLCSTVLNLQNSRVRCYVFVRFTR